jgi:hypothetical protein
VIFFPVIFNSHLSVLQGTAPFMAVELLMQKSGIRHTPQHDLESLFFVLVYICTNLSGPGTIRTQAELKLHSTIPLSAWFKVSSTLHQIGIHKIGSLHTLDSSILRRFAPYFDELKPCVRQLFKAIYGNLPGTPSKVTHAEIIKIFTDTLDTLAPEVASSNTYRPLLTNSPSHRRKHSLGIHDNNLGKWDQKKRRTSSIDTGSISGIDTSSISGVDTGVTSPIPGVESGVTSSASGRNVWVTVSGDHASTHASTSNASRGRRGSRGHRDRRERRSHVSTSQPGDGSFGGT